MHRSTGQDGFTLVELTAVIAIVGTLSAVALPRYADMLRSARVAKMEMARGAVREAAHVYHMKWMLAGSPPAASVMSGVQMNETGYPTSAGILVAAGLDESFDTRVAGVIAVDQDHPACRLVYAPESGTTASHFADGTAC